MSADHDAGLASFDALTRSMAPELAVDVLPARPVVLAAPAPAFREAVFDIPRTPVDHAQAMRSLACLTTLEALPFAPARNSLAFPLTCVAWNLERCLFPHESASLIRATGADVVLLSEMDNGMARTKQVHTAKVIADALGMGCVYGVEFFELGLGGQNERQFCADDFNEKGFHGNALLTPTLIQDAVMLRLDDSGLWFCKAGDQPRIGGRCAIIARLPTTAGPMMTVSVHLESDADGAYRHKQSVKLFDAIDALGGSLPVLIGGDLNTGNRSGGDLSAEGLFEEARVRGYQAHGGAADAMTLRRSLISNVEPPPLKLDWFLSRGLIIGESVVVPALSQAGTPLSDHELIWCRVDGFV